MNSATYTSTSIHESYSWGQELPEPEVIVPSITLAAAAVGALVGYYARGWRTRRTEAAAQRQIKEAEANKHAEHTTTHSGTTLVLKNLLANVAITEGNGEMTVTVGGKSRRMDAVKSKTYDNTLTIEGPAAYVNLSDFGSIFDSWIMRKLIKRTGIEIVDATDVLEVTAVVPAGTNLTVKRVDGTVQSQGSFGDLIAEPSFGGRMSFDRVRDVDISPGSYGKISIGHMDGSLKADVGFAGKVVISNGHVSPADARLGSYSGLTVNAAAHNAKVHCGYSSQAQLLYASGVVSLSTESYAKAHVTDGEATQLTISVGYDGRAGFGGSTKEAWLSSQSYGKVSTGNVTGKLVVRGGYGSRIKVGSPSNISPADVRLESYSKLDVQGHIGAGTIAVGYSGLVSAASYDPQVRKERAGYGRIIVTKKS